MHELLLLLLLALIVICLCCGHVKAFIVNAAVVPSQGHHHLWTTLSSYSKP